MKLSETKPYLESSGELEEQFFAIQDQGMIFDILRNKMYSNPILAICREISCNARDAHREVSNPDPVVIHLPNNLEPYYKIRDFGPGISPDRMTNIFIKYTASTKRSDNIQTGGFGLGAKTPFSYSDSFSIITVVDGFRYNYNCLIDETKVGKIMLANQSPSKEKNGTEIIIPVMPKNFNDFRTYTEQACRHWKVKPVIKGGTIDWQVNKLILEGDNWGIAASNGHYGSRNAQMIIDGIEYPLDLTALRNYADTKLIDAAQGNFVMHFGVGELSLSASRESIYLDEKTQAVIRGRFDKIKKSLSEEAMTKIESFTNLWDANVYYNKELRKAFSNIEFLGVLTWRKIPLTNSHLQFGTKVFSFTKGKYSKKHGTDPNKLSRGHGEYINFEDGAALYFNDLTIKEPTPRHVKKAFEDDPKLKTVFVICPTDKLTKDVLEKKLHLDKMNMKLLSAITKATGRAYTPAAQRLLLFKYDERASAFRQVSYASVDEDSNSKVLCTLFRDSYTGSRSAILKGKSHLDWTSLKSLRSKFPTHSFYGVDDGTSTDRIKEDFSDFENLSTFIKEKIFGNSAIDYVKIKYASSHNNDVEERIIRVIDKIKPMIKNKASVFIKTIELQLLIRGIAKQDTGLLSMYESLNGSITEDQLKDFVKANPALDIVKLNNLFDKRYPMIGHINSYNYQEIVGDIAHYVNLIDKENDNVK